MLLKIYGKKNCPFCVKAKKYAEDLKGFRNDFNFEYIDYQEAGMSKEDVAEKVGRSVETLPQIVLDESYIGGCTEFETYIRKNRLFAKK